jgi:hypothetical protein
MQIGKMGGAFVALLSLSVPAFAQAQTNNTATRTVTFTRDIAPIVYANCTTCHRPGEVAPFPLQTFQDVQKRAKQIVLVTESRLMPPWKPQAGHGKFQDERTLTSGEIALIKKWAETGTPQGNPGDLPPMPKFPEGWKLGKPDLILRLSQPFQIPAEGEDVYQHFVFSLGEPKERYLRGIEVRPSNRRVTHHAVGILDSWGKARQLDAATSEQGYRNMGGAGFVPSGFTPGYVPGAIPRPIPEDSAITLPKGADFVLQMHYHPTGKVEYDQTEVGLYFTEKKPTRIPAIALLGSNDIDIKPGDSAYRVKDEFKLPADFLVSGIWAHMHLIGKDVRVWAELPDGSTRKLLWIPDWDFNWQDTYTYAEPFRLPAGTRIKSEFVFDNSASNPRNPNNPPQRVLTGENSTDEMAGLIISGHANDGLGALAIFAADVGHYFELEGKAARAKAEAEKVKRERARKNKTMQRKSETPDSIGLMLFYGGISGGSGLAVGLLLHPVATWGVLVLVGAGSLTAMTLLFGRASQQAHDRLRASWLRCLGRGLVLSGGLGLLTLALLFAPDKGAQVLGLVLFLGLLVAAVRGTGGIVRMTCSRLTRTPAETFGLREIVRGSVVVSVAALVPVVGWFVVAPLLLVAALGAGLPAVSLPQHRSESRPADAETNRLLALGNNVGS